MSATPRKQKSPRVAPPRSGPERADPPSDLRPDITPAIEGVVAAAIDTLPSLRGLVADDVVVVAVGAHGDAVASVRGFGGSAASVVVGGRRRRVELGLRPRFFLEGDAPKRLAVLIHELLHLDPDRPGALLAANRHQHRSTSSLNAEAARGAVAVLAAAPPTLTLALAHHGEVHVRSWRRRPCENTARRRFGDDDTFDAIVAMHTPAPVRGGWW